MKLCRTQKHQKTSWTNLRMFRRFEESYIENSQNLDAGKLSHLKSSPIIINNKKIKNSGDIFWSKSWQFSRILDWLNILTFFSVFFILSSIA